MSIDKTIVFTIIAGFFTSGEFQIIAGFTVDEYDGVWYHIGSLSNDPLSDGHLECYYFIIKKEKDNAFNVVHKFKLYGDYFEVSGHGWVINSEIIEKISIVNESQSIGTIQSFNNGRVLIYQQKFRKNVVGLIARSREASDEVKTVLEETAKNAGVNVLWTKHHERCQYI